MKRILLLLIISLTSTVCSQAQKRNGIKLVEPLTLIDTVETKFAALGWVNNFFTPKRYAYYRTDEQGVLFYNGGYVGSRNTDSALVAIPSGWTSYDPPCEIVPLNIIAYWNIDGQSYPLRAQSFQDSLWLTQTVTYPTPNSFVVRGKNMLTRGDVELIQTNLLDDECYSQFAGGNTDFGGLVNPSSFTTPLGFTTYYSADSTLIYTNGTPPETGGGESINAIYTFNDGKEYKYDAAGNATLVMDLELYESGGSTFIRDNKPNEDFSVPGVNIANCVIRYFIQGNPDPINSGVDLVNGYNVTAWRGRPIQIIKAYVNTVDIGVKQMLSGYLYVPNVSNTLETIKTIGSDSIFYSPLSYSLPENNSALPTFLSSFPNEVYNNGGIKAIFYSALGDDQADYTRVGLLNRNGGSTGYANISDAWLYNTGHPRQPFTQTQFDNYYNANSGLLAGSFESQVGSQNGNRLVMLNNEAYDGKDGGGTWSSSMYSTVYGLYNSYKTSYPNSQLYPWGTLGYTMQLDNSGAYGTTTVWQQWLDSQTMSQATFDATYPCGAGNFGCETNKSDVENTGMYTVGQYFISYRETQQNLFQQIHGFIIGERMRPTFNAVLNLWSDLETVDDNTQGWITGKTSSGRTWRQNFKAAAFPQDMYNSGAIAGFFHTKGGFVVWDYPNVGYTNNPDDWYQGHWLDTGEQVSNQNTSPGTLPVRQYANKSKQNIDEFLKGYWAVMENADLITGNLEWAQIKVSGTYQDEQNSFYGAAMRYRRGFAAYRKVGNEALVYAANFFGDSNTNLEFRIYHNGVWVEKSIPLTANYASIVRVQL
jgi:hypothetical protein